MFIKSNFRSFMDNDLYVLSVFPCGVLIPGQEQKATSQFCQQLIFAQFYEQLTLVGRFGSQELLPSDLQANLGFPDLLENIDKVYMISSRRFAMKKLLTYVLGPPRAI